MKKILFFVFSAFLLLQSWGCQSTEDPSKKGSGDSTGPDTTAIAPLTEWEEEELEWEEKTTITDYDENGGTDVRDAAESTIDNQSGGGSGKKSRYNTYPDGLVLDEMPKRAFTIQFGAYSIEQNAINYQIEHRLESYTMIWLGSGEDGQILYRVIWVPASRKFFNNREDVESGFRTERVNNPDFANRTPSKVEAIVEVTGAKVQTRLVSQ